MIGAQDRIDQLLVKKYANLKTITENTNVSHLAVPADRVLDIMNDYGQMQRMALAMQSRLKQNKGMSVPQGLQPAHQYVQG